MVIINIECAMKQEFLNSWNPKFYEFPWSRLWRHVRAPCAILPNKIFPRTHPTHIYVSHAIQILKNPPEYTMRNRVQSGRNTKNNMHAHLLGIA